MVQTVHPSPQTEQTEEESVSKEMSFSARVKQTTF